MEATQRDSGQKGKDILGIWYADWVEALKRKRNWES